MGIEKCQIVRIGLRLHLSDTTAIHATEHDLCQRNAVHFVEIGSSIDKSQLQLPVIHAFCKEMQTTIDSHDEELIVICLEDDSPTTKRNACLLCGAYLILCEGASCHIVLDEFKDLGICFGACESSDLCLKQESGTNKIEECWRAIERARNLRWIQFPHPNDPDPLETDDAPLFDIEMAVHYALPANGDLHVLIPGKLLLFPPPSQLAAGLHWIDCASQDDPGPARSFSAAFQAELLEEFEVAAVVNPGGTSPGDAGAFRARGIDVHHLGWEPGRPALLGALDRLLALHRAASAPVAAMFGGEGPGRGGVETLAAAWLVTDCGFDGGAAAAWVRMALPAGAP